MVHLINDGDRFNELFLRGMDCIFIDSGRRPSVLVKMLFEDAAICTPDFASLVLQLMQWADEESCHYIVMRPDPVLHFYRLYGEYPAVEISRRMTPDDYLEALNKGPVSAPYEAIGSAYRERVIVSPSLKWFVHSFVSSEVTDGHLWIPKEWLERVASIYPYAELANPCNYGNTFVAEPGA